MLVCYNSNGSLNKLFCNMGNFYFMDVFVGLGVENIGWMQVVGYIDLNGDGWQDFVVGNDFGMNSYYINNQDGIFMDVSMIIGIDKLSYMMNVGVGDVNGDLSFDFYIFNIVVMEKDDKYVFFNEDIRVYFDLKFLVSM